ncbi:2-polyprenyl-3-methyl-5-hydroxy-6-metoxy-1,4-benzoquinol methylase [Solirubrobacter pauli]|uniref:2-polyprenyl-3-methyl-5-hydroxy-6-metoxy-1, 4-benzoquinol methylase n=1 Tax=Solirubrobacter pauli TaxID=166793 RepID=A0A660LFE2_9ACTN|nr:class I SAM-dependent methyltransferase [Solirubrobacter pauli]RKQ92905.1 2-polyprenyl-3-methyl-5-hydroxy-6-metoxy-1,4-benzoquinol methylase [Solirubrobacter pauli]
MRFASSDTDTPLRRLDLKRQAGALRLGDAEGSWLDGAEAEIRDELLAVDDRSAVSPELIRRARRTWETRYHFSPARANVMRALDLEGLTVLEVGAGCGAVTRYLGETCANVDALEPNGVRAGVAALRCEDLDSVEVFHGSLEDVPLEPVYDAVVMVGVLEYVGGSAGWDDRVRFLRDAAARVRPGGSVVCAIENRLGAQYLAGAPEEHVAQPFAGLEDYPRSGPARTFDRPTIERLFREAGLQTTVLGLFPDYKFARFVFHDRLLDGPRRPLAWRFPRFPSTGSPHPRARLASEYHLWRSLVEGRLGGQFANSFLVVATADGQPDLWPEEREAAAWSTERAAPYLTQTEVVSSGQLRRRRLADAAEASALEHAPRDSAFRSGRPLLEQMETASAAALPALVSLWRGHVEATAGTGDAVNVDISPEHVLGATERSLVTIDEEWFHRELGVDFALGRGLLNAVFMLVDRRPPEAWPDGCVTTRDVFTTLARDGGLRGRAADLEWICAQEARLLSEIEVGDASAEAAIRKHLNASLERPLADGVLGAREVEFRDAAGQVPELHETARWLHREVAARDQRIAELEVAVERLDRTRIPARELARELGRRVRARAARR